MSADETYLRDRIAALEAENAECRAAMHTISAEITRLVERANELANENANLRNIIYQAQHIKPLTPCYPTPIR